MKNRYTQLRVSILFIFLTLLFCWLFCGKYGVFGSKVDWISQHSVFPDYFRQQFYDTGDFFPNLLRIWVAARIFIILLITDCTVLFSGFRTCCPL